jgi:hypothetical protein
MNLLALVPIARNELSRKSLKDVQVDTAYTWASRAVAAVNLQRLSDAREYWHEAVEHAALAGNGILADIRAQAAALVPMQLLES